MITYHTKFQFVKNKVNQQIYADYFKFVILKIHKEKREFKYFNFEQNFKEYGLSEIIL